MTQVTPGTPAERVGLKAGDEITAVDDARVRNIVDLIGIIQSHQVGDHVTLELLREGRRQRVKVVLTRLPN